MSTRSFLPPAIVINAQSMAANITSAVTVLQTISTICYQASWTGSTPVGTLSVQISLDYALNPNGTVQNSGTWTTLTLNVSGTPSTTVPVSGNTGSFVIDPIVTGASAVRLIYTAGSGSGSLTAEISGRVQ